MLRLSRQKGRLMKRKVLVVMAGLLFSLTATTTGCANNSSSHNEKERIVAQDSADMVVIKDSVFTVKDIEDHIDSLNNQIDSVLYLKTSLIDEVYQYIHSVAPRTRMSATNIVELCIERDYDITLLLSQAHLETHFGTSGRNVFGIVGQCHKHPDNYVPGYIDLMQRRYVINRSTEEVLRSNVCIEGNPKARYAGNPNYGRELTGIRRNILSGTNIYQLFTSIMDIKTQRL